ncbi:hypothetical protein [Microseira sp. BLCC-F43]|uniref:hypothetical protein n=1 Tax=Microseira sp. BLCC-F43 TaxID=3153602 RepID=UPI0035B9D8D0
MNLAKLTKKLTALTKKLAAFVKLNCRNLIRKVAVEITRTEGEIEKLTPRTATPDTSAKYSWDKDFSKCTNLEKGKTYFVSNYTCTCESKLYKTGQINGTCKHVRMRAELLKSYAKEFDLTVPEGTEIKRSSDWAALEYEAFALRRVKEIKSEFVGTIVLGKTTATAYPLKGVSKDFDEVFDAVTYLAKAAKLSLKELKDLATEKEWAEGGEEYYPDYEYA